MSNTKVGIFYYFSHFGANLTKKIINYVAGTPIGKLYANFCSESPKDDSQGGHTHVGAGPSQKFHTTLSNLHKASIFYYFFLLTSDITVNRN